MSYLVLVWLLNGTGLTFTTEFTIAVFGLYGDHWYVVCFILLLKVFVLFFSVYVRPLCDEMCCLRSWDWKKNVLQEELKLWYSDCKTNKKWNTLELKSCFLKSRGRMSKVTLLFHSNTLEVFNNSYLPFGFISIGNKDNWYSNVYCALKHTL